MADVHTYDTKTLEPFKVDVEGSFRPNGTSPPITVATEMLGVASVTRQGVGQYRLTTQHRWPALIRVHQPAVQHATPDDYKVCIGAIDLTNKTIDIHVFDGAGAAVDIAANASNRIWFGFTFRNKG